MADFVPYSCHVREDRPQHGEFVLLSAERWQWLVDYIRVNYGDNAVTNEITVFEPTIVNGVMFLPARYRAPEDWGPAAVVVEPIAPDGDVLTSAIH
ncbi:MAG: hypothetical protein PS018_11515 [bacterium]|nr:hypothetical protein [bacterium]